jgi:acetylornithine deacetylase/succinyl-diaminopimelate desuccinylase-like protein
MHFDQYLQENKKNIINDFLDFLKIPSITNNPKKNHEIQKAVNYLKNSLIKAGVCKVEICHTNRHPIVYAEKIINKDFPTILIYGHYDVLPAKIDDGWLSDPFKPLIKNNKIYARGASDNKGQLFAHIKAFEYLNKTKQLKHNVKFIFEGEEEAGSPSLRKFVQKHKKRFSVNTIIISDTEMLSDKKPSITTGLRGIITMQVEILNRNMDLHSGMYSGLIDNPVYKLCAILMKLKDENNKILIPGFYDNIQDISEEERQSINNIPNNYKKLPNINNEQIKNHIEMASLKPSLEINGIWGGYSGPGTKTIIPKNAGAKISIRTVAGQRSKKIIKSTIKTIKSLSSKKQKLKISKINCINPYSVNLKDDNFKTIQKAYYSVYKEKPLLLRSGVCIAAANILKSEIGVSPLLMGFALTSDQSHSCNEHVNIDQFFKSIQTIISFHKNYYLKN